mmetsp:Transcript_127777/g.220864  ORF Transcript_127777/g.220864 Transcript_127777/m.220864 type:complete len:232 (-) Transcript_127777:1371-2066(-)
MWNFTAMAGRGVGGQGVMLLMVHTSDPSDYVHAGLNQCCLQGYLHCVQAAHPGTSCLKMRRMLATFGNCCVWSPGSEAKMCQTRRVLSPKSTARVFNRCVHAVQKPPFGRIVLCMKFPLSLRLYCTLHILYVWACPGPTKTGLAGGLGLCHGPNRQPDLSAQWHPRCRGASPVVQGLPPAQAHRNGRRLVAPQRREDTRFSFLAFGATQHPQQAPRVYIISPVVWTRGPAG